jgi:hypothetical protein
MVSFYSRVFLLTFCLDNLSVDERGILKSYTTTMLGFTRVFKPSSIYLMKLGALMLGAYKLKIVISS